MSSLQLQQSTGVGSAAIGEALLGAWAGQPVTIHAIPDAVGASYLHELLSSPTGAAPLLTGITSQNAQFTPTTGVKGRYRVRTTITEATGVSVKITRIVEVIRDSSGVLLGFGLSVPALSESPGEGAAGAQPRGYVDNFQQNTETTERLIQNAGAFGKKQTLPDSDTTALSAYRQYVASTITALRTISVEDGTEDGEIKVLHRRITNKSRIRFVGASGYHIAWLNRTMSVPIKWDADAGKWIPLSQANNGKIFYPEDFGPDVGVGDATADRAALVACFQAHVDFANQADNELASSVQLSTMYYVNEGVDVPGTDYTALRIHGVTPSGNGGFRGCGITYTGSAAKVMSGTPSLTFDRAARTITRSTGSFVSDGFAAGMRILVADPTGGSVVNNRIYDVESVSALTITVAAPAATYPVVPFATDGMMPYTEGPKSGFVLIQASHVLRIKGASGVLLEDLVIQGDEKALLPLWADIVPDDPNATNMRQVRFRRCSVYGRFPHKYGSNITYGRPGSAPAVGSDLNNTWTEECVCQNTYGSHLGACIRYWDGNNTKLHRVLKCELWSAERAIDHEAASEGLSVQDTHFEDADLAVYNNGYVEISNCHSERVGQSVIGGRGRCLENNNSWNLNGSLMQVAQQASHEMNRCTYSNGTVTLSVSSVNTSIDVWTVVNNAERLPQNSDPVVVRSASGWVGMPSLLQAQWHDRACQIFYLGDVTLVSGSTYTCTLRQTPGGATVDVVTAGTDVWFLSPALFVTSHGLSKPGGDGQGISFDGCHIMGAEDVPMVGAADGTTVFDTFYSSPASAAGRASVRHSFGFTPGPVVRALAEIASVPMFGNAQKVPLVLYYAEQTEWVLRGADGWSILRVRAASLASGTFRAGSFAIFYVDLPYRCGVEMVTAEVPTSFAAPGLSAAMVKVGHVDVGQGDGDDDDAYLLSTSLMTFPNASDRRKGFSAGERGVRLATPPYWPKYTGATDWSWNARMTMVVRIDLTGATISQLTAGDLLLGFKLIQTPDWKRS